MKAKQNLKRQINTLNKILRSMKDFNALGYNPNEAANKVVELTEKINRLQERRVKK